MSADLSFGISVAGVSDAVATLQRIGQAIGQTEQATQRQAQGANSARQANDAFGSSLQSSAARVAGMANAVQSLATRLGSQGQSAGLVGSVASTIAQFSAMGATLGPGGAVAGAIAGLALSVRDLAAAHTEAAQAAAAQAQAEQQLANAGAIDTAIRTGGDLSQFTDRERAVATQARRIRLAAAQEELASAENESSGILGILNGPGAQIAHARAEQLRRDIEQIGIELRTLGSAAQSSGDATGLSGLSAGGGARLYGLPTTGDVAAMTGLAEGTQRLYERADAQERVRITAEDARNAEAAFIAEMMQASGHDAFSGVITEGISDEAIAQLARGTQAQQEYQRTIVREAQAAKESQHRLADAAITAQQAFDNGYVDSIDSVVEAYRRWDHAARAAGDSSDRSGRAIQRGAQAAANSIVDHIGGTATSAFQSAVGAWLTGAESFEQAAKHMGEAIIQSLVSEAIVQTVVELARAAAAAASSYGTDPAIEMHLVAAGMWAGVGAVAGGIGAAAGSFGHAPGAGAKGATTRDAASPDREAQRASSGSNGPLTLNVFPGGFTTKADVTAGVIDAMRHAARLGYTLPPQLIRQGA